MSQAGLLIRNLRQRNIVLALINGKIHYNSINTIGDVDLSQIVRLSDEITNILSQKGPYSRHISQKGINYWEPVVYQT